MKKFLLILTMVLSMLVNISFATEGEILEDLKNEDNVEATETDETFDNSVYVDSYQDYLDAINGVNEQEQYKELYNEMLIEQIESYDSTKRPDVLKAIVTEVKDTEEYYSYDAYGTYKIKYQPIIVKMLEGEYKDREFDVSYILTADSYENINVKEVKVNQKINVVVEEVEGEPYVYATTVDSSIDRVKCTIILIIVTIILLFALLGTKTFKILPEMILLVDLILIMFVPNVFGGTSIVWLSIVSMVLYVVANSATKVGVNAKMAASILATIITVFVTTTLLLAFNEITSMSGIIYEITSIIEAFPKGTIDFNMLNISIYILMATVVISDIVCQTINLYNGTERKLFREQVNEYVSEKTLAIFGVLLVTLIPKYLYFLVTKYSTVEILNSEMLTNEIARILFLVIGSIIAKEIAIITRKLLVDND